MAKSITQISIFGQDDVENLQDLERLRLVLEYIPDQDLIHKLNYERQNGRNDYPVHAMWNSVLAGIMYQHRTTEELRRELSRNSDLRRVCGFDDGKTVPTKDAYSRFLKLLIKNRKYIITNIFDKLVNLLKNELPDLGKDLAMDSKAISSFAKRENKKRKKDGRRDTDADTGYKTYKGIGSNGKAWEKVTSWFGYKLHLIVDANYELPLNFKVTRASESDVTTGHRLVDDLARKQPEILNKDRNKSSRCATMSADKGYDDGKLFIKLYDEYKVKPVIDIKNMWRNGEETKQLSGYDNIVYDYLGNTYCYNTKGKRKLMVNGGFDSSRNTLRKLCPAKEKGVFCADCKTCSARNGIRISIKEDRRIFTPIDRTSYKWKKRYALRTSVERVNSRIDNLYGFEYHCIRGREKMETRCTLALIVMLSLAYARVKEKRLEDMRRFNTA